LPTRACRSKQKGLQPSSGGAKARRAVHSIAQYGSWAWRSSPAALKGRSTAVELRRALSSFIPTGARGCSSALTIWPQQQLRRTATCSSGASRTTSRSPQVGHVASRAHASYAHSHHHPAASSTAGTGGQIVLMLADGNSANVGLIKQAVSNITVTNLTSSNFSLQGRLPDGKVSRPWAVRKDSNPPVLGQPLRDQPAASFTWKDGRLAASTESGDFQITLNTTNGRLIARADSTEPSNFIIVTAGATAALLARDMPSCAVLRALHVLHACLTCRQA
jgi:hypothetical protein